MGDLDYSVHILKNQKNIKNKRVEILTHIGNTAIRWADWLED